MKHIFKWHVLLILSAFLLITGILLAAYGIYNRDFIVGYSGLSVITVICGSWWIWVMSLIHKVLIVSQRTIKHSTELKDGIREFRILLEDNKSFIRDK